MTATSTVAEAPVRIPVKSALEAIHRRRGDLRPDIVVDESRPDDAPLHSHFEWDDTIAGEQWRLEQAAAMIRAVPVRLTRSDGETVTTRAWVSTRNTKASGRGVDQDDDQNSYEPVQVVLADVAKRERYVAAMRRDLELCRDRYKHITELSSVAAEVFGLNVP